MNNVHNADRRLFLICHPSPYPDFIYGSENNGKKVSYSGIAVKRKSVPWGFNHPHGFPFTPQKA